MTLKRQDVAGSALIAALEDAWKTLGREHPELPPVVLITGAGSLGTGRGLRLGHFAADRWQAEQRGTLAEIFVGGEGLARGARPVLATLLHEAAHALAHRRGVKDTSRQGRYHNQRFKTIAEELGLEVEHHPTLGWSVTTLPAAAGARYRPAIAKLARALTAHREGECKPSGRRRPDHNLKPCDCGCPRRIRIAPGVLALGPIVCSVCDQPFRPVKRVGGVKTTRCRL
jgi:hypothetical protein